MGDEVEVIEVAELEPGTYSVAEVARRLGVGEQTLRDWIRRDVSPIKPLPLPGRRMRFSRPAVERWLADNGQVAS